MLLLLLLLHLGFASTSFVSPPPTDAALLDNEIAQRGRRRLTLKQSPKPTPRTLFRGRERNIRQKAQRPVGQATLSVETGDPTHDAMSLGRVLNQLLFRISGMSRWVTAQMRRLAELSPKDKPMRIPRLSPPWRGCIFNQCPMTDRRLICGAVGPCRYQTRAAAPRILPCLHIKLWLLVGQRSDGPLGYDSPNSTSHTESPIAEEKDRPVARERERACVARDSKVAQRSVSKQRPLRRTLPLLRDSLD